MIPNCHNFLVTKRKAQDTICHKHHYVWGAFKKFCNSIWGRSDISKIFTLFFNIIALNSNTYVKSVKKLFDASQIELWWHAVQIRLSTQWPVWSHCHHETTSSDDEIGRIHWVPDLLSRVGVTTIPIPCPLLQPTEQEQGSKMMNKIKQASESYLGSMQQKFYLTDMKELFDKCNLCIAATGDYPSIHPCLFAESTSKM